MTSKRSLWTKEMRLRRPEDFRRVWSGGRSWAHPLFVLWGCPNTLEHTRVGITASRKVGHAVERNRARRVLREAARHTYPDTIDGWDIVLVARSRILGASEGQVETALRQALSHARLLRTQSAEKVTEDGELSTPQPSVREPGV